MFKIHSKKKKKAYNKFLKNHCKRETSVDFTIKLFKLNILSHIFNSKSKSIFTID